MFRTNDGGGVARELLEVIRIVILGVALSAGASRGAGPEPLLLRWGGDAEGGAPFVEADPADPAKVRGFDVEVAEALAKGLGRTPRFVQVAYQTIDQSVQRGDFDIGMSGMEDAPQRRETLALTLPYFEFREVLAVRSSDADRIHTLADLRGRKVGTLAGTIAYDTLLAAEAVHGLVTVSYDDDVHPYEDLARGRVDAVLLDHVLAARSLRRVPGLAILPGAVTTGRYVGVLAKENAALRDSIDGLLMERMRDGTLRRIFEKWNVWDEEQAKFEEREIAAHGAAKFPSDGNTAGAEAASVGAAPFSSSPSKKSLFSASSLPLVLSYLPSLFRASLVTIVLTCLSMALAVVFGVAIASGRVYGSAPLRMLLTAYVELMRGTPVLLQLFVLYYGLSELVRLPAFVAALLGLGLNYAAYESEIYRGALEAVPRGQLEAARTLGLTERQVLRLVRGPQAFRIALAPMTNDFVALLKDSSLVSVVTVVELTKQTAIFATNIGSWALPGALCAALYLAMSLPLSRLARRLEERWSAPST
jgi:polar amino acid transport system substrate-binding protein